MSLTLQKFEQREIRAAIAHAAAGGMALHLMSGVFAHMRKDTPNCFKNQRVIAHLFDQSERRLVRTARQFGVRIIRVERRGQPGQHIDLCGKPLERAMREVGRELARAEESRQEVFAL